VKEEDNRPQLDVLIVTGIFPPDIGGPATYVPALGAALVKRGHRVAVVTLSDSPDDDGANPFSVSRIRRRLFKLFRVPLTVAAIIRMGWDADLLFVNGLYLEAIVANLILRKPQVQKWVGDWAWERATNKRWLSSSFEMFQDRWCGVKAELLKGLRNFCVRRADTVIVPSRYLGRAVAQWGVAREKIVTIYNSIESASFTPAAIPFPTKFKLVTVGRLIALKRIDEIIRSVGKCQNTALIIIGDGPEREPLQALVRDQGWRERIYFAGQRTKAETLALMAACDLFVLNSTHEGFPHVVLEAMSLGLPVVATAVGGTPELIRDGENGLLFSVESDRALSDILARLLDSPAERERLASGAQRTVGRFRYGTMIEETEAVLWGLHERLNLKSPTIPHCSGAR
jgi:glycosyltransferase involved in cell wall biosynthesis